MAERRIIQNRYEVVRYLGKGGMGAVFECHDSRLNCKVAVKLMLSDAEFSHKRFEREANLLANLQHPNLPRVTDFFQEDDNYFLVMEYISGFDLQIVIDQKEHAFSFDDVDIWLPQLVVALRYLHKREQPIIHRDIKPSNLKLTGRGHLFLLDFGIARGKAGLMNTQFSFTEPGCGTPAFAPFEQLHGDGTSVQSDIFSVGASLYYLLTRTLPVNSYQRAASLVNAQPDPLVDLDSLLPIPGGNKSRAIMRALSMNVAERPPSIGSFSRLYYKKEAPAVSAKPAPQLNKVKDIPSPSQKLQSKPYEYTYRVESVVHKNGFFRSSTLPRFILTLSLLSLALLLTAVFARMPYGFYILLRWICAPTLVFMAFADWERNRTVFAVIFSILAIIFNPVVPFGFDKSFWAVIDIIASLLFLIRTIGCLKDIIRTSKEAREKKAN